MSRTAHGDLNVTLRDQNLDLLRQGIALLESLDTALYSSVGAASSIGAHIRHCIDCYRCFLAGVADDARQIDYDARERSASIEADPECGCRALREIAAAIEVLSVAESEVVLVRVDQPERRDDGDAWQRSSVGRELQYLISHTTHHYALIAMLLIAGGHQPAADFGLAPSTRAYRRSQVAAACAG